MGYDCRVEPPMLCSIVNIQEISFSTDDIYATLQFGSVVEDNGPTEYSYLFIMGYAYGVFGADWGF